MIRYHPGWRQEPAPGRCQQRRGDRTPHAKTINNQLSAIFNYACKYYGLGLNPPRLADSVGKKHADEMKFWTVEQFNQFIPNVPKLPGRIGLSVLFWAGIRIGDLCQEIKAYMDALYEPDPDDRLFSYTKSYFHRQMQAGCDGSDFLVDAFKDRLDKD